MRSRTTPRRRELRLDKLALFASLGYAPHEGQLPVHLSAAPRRVLAAGVRAGKSRSAAMEVVAALLEPRPRSLGWVVGPTLDLTARILGEVERLVHDHLPERIIEHSPREHRLVIANLAGGRSEVRGKSADNPVSLLGEGLDWVVVDEAARMRADIWEAHLSQRLLDRRGWALLLSTPRGPDWFFELFERGQRGEAGFESWNYPSWVNPHLSREAIELERERLPAHIFAQEYEAQFVGTPPRCRSCGFPRVDAPPIVLLRGDEELARCPACGREVDAAGLCVRRPEPPPEGSLRTIRLIGDVGPPEGAPDGMSDHDLLNCAG